MTGYILADNPELSVSETINRSKKMMEGNRLRLFCLEFSFCGWRILCALTLGIGNLWLIPYRKAAIAAFYREVSGTENQIYEFLGIKRGDSGEKNKRSDFRRTEVFAVVWR